MPAFDEEFAAAMGQPISYRGNQISRLDRFPLKGTRKFRVTFESTNSKYRQGIGIDLRQFCDSLVNGNLTPKSNWSILWEDTAPKHVDVELLGAADYAAIFNVWQDPNRVMIAGVTGSGQVTHYWTNGAAMIIEEIPNGRRYRCNDGEPDDDFDDLIFTVERVPD